MYTCTQYNELNKFLDRIRTRFAFTFKMYDLENSALFTSSRLFSHINQFDANAPFIHQDLDESEKVQLRCFHFNFKHLRSHREMTSLKMKNERDAAKKIILVRNSFVVRRKKK